MKTPEERLEAVISVLRKQMGYIEVAIPKIKESFHAEETDPGMLGYYQGRVSTLEDQLFYLAKIHAVAKGEDT